MLLREGWSDVEVDDHLKHFLQDYRNAGLPEEDVFMLDYVRKVTLDPSTVRRKDIDRLRLAGFNDLAIHDICAIAAYFAYVNRLADGLGIATEERFEGQEYARAGRGYEKIEISNRESNL